MQQGFDSYHSIALTAAALALVGWTVMLPPTKCQSGAGGTPYFDFNAPLHEWQLAPVTPFATERECNAELTRLRQELTDGEHHRKFETMKRISDEKMRQAGNAAGGADVQIPK